MVHHHDDAGDALRNDPAATMEGIVSALRMAGAAVKLVKHGNVTELTGFFGAFSP